MLLTQLFQLFPVILYSHYLFELSFVDKFIPSSFFSLSHPNKLSHLPFFFFILSAKFVVCSSFRVKRGNWLRLKSKSCLKSSPQLQLFYFEHFILHCSNRAQKNSFYCRAHQYNKNWFFVLALRFQGFIFKNILVVLGALKYWMKVFFSLCSIFQFLEAVFDIRHQNQFFKSIL